MDTTILVTFIASALRQTTPLLFAALGGLYSERAGIVNIALEGIMIFGALTGAVVTQQIQSAMLLANPNADVAWVAWLGLLAAMVAGALVALVHGILSIRYKADQVISGTAVNLLALGVPAVVLQFLYNNTSDSKEVPVPLPKLPGLFGIEELKFSPLTYLAFLLVPITAYIVYRTRFGLRLRAVGEAPVAAASVGVNVIRVRYTAVIVSGVLAATAGAFLSIGNLDKFFRAMSASQGFIALAALIFGRWQPWSVLASTLLFGTFRAIAIQLSGTNFLPSTVVEALPYLLTMLVLAGFIGRARAPKAIGVPYP